MKQIKLSGREVAVLRAIDPSMGTSGAEISALTHLPPDELLEILNGLAEVGYVESFAPGKDIPLSEPVTPAALAATRFEVNPSYALELKQAMLRR
jgi:hypothetical protein